MTSEIKSGMIKGITGTLVTIQSDISDGLPMIQMTGYLASEVKEAKDRVRTALKNTGYRLPTKRISVNFSPGDLKKNGVFFDIAIAVSLLTAAGQIINHHLDSYILLGELALDGRILPIRGVLPILYTALQQGITRCIIPVQNKMEAEFLQGFSVYAFQTLQDIIYFLNHEDSYCEPESLSFSLQSSGFQDYDFSPTINFTDIKGQEFAKRAMIIAAAGFHNILLNGPPGSGKSMMAAALPGIMPPPSWQEQLEILMIHSVKGSPLSEIDDRKIRPYRRVSAGITKSGLLGGGISPIPGEITLAHHGVLFIDEISELDRSTLEALRTPLENHSIQLVRSQQTVVFPSDFLLACACNPCPCGYYPNRQKCRCTDIQIRRYHSKLSGPIRDRIDLYVQCDLPSFEDLSEKPVQYQNLEEIQFSIQRAWEIQMDRQNHIFNSRLNHEQIEKFCSLDSESYIFMKNAYHLFQLTGRSYYKVLRTARTIADLRDAPSICLCDLQEALQYRTTYEDFERSM